MEAITIKQSLLSLISEMAKEPEHYVKNPGKDFTRNRKLTFETMLKMMLCMGGNTLNEELYDGFEFSADTPSVSAFVQQRNKLFPTALQELFERFNDDCYENVFHQGYQLLAIDGTDLRLPTNKSDDLSFMQNEETMNGYNLMHLDAMYDLLRNIYVDVSLQTKKEENEHKAFVKMVDSSISKNKTIVIADRGYESYNNMVHIQEKRWNNIIRAKDSYGIISRLFDVLFEAILLLKTILSLLHIVSSIPFPFCSLCKISAHCCQNILFIGIQNILIWQQILIAEISKPYKI